MKSPALHEVDPAIVEGMAPPSSFIDGNYSPEELMMELGMDDASTFWLAVRDGRIPRGVWLPVNPPMCCWNAEFVQEWIRLGCPPDVIHEAHKAIVYQNLVETVRGSLSTFPPTVTEQN